MRVLLINQAFYPDTVATAQHTTDLAIYLKRQGHEVAVLCSRRAYSQPKEVFPKQEEYRGIRIHRVMGTGLGKRYFAFRIIDIFTLQLALLFKLMFLSKHDVVIAFTSPPLVSFLAMIYCRWRCADLISWLMDINPDAAIAAGYLRARSPVARLLVFIFRLTLKHSRHVIVLDRWMRDRLSVHNVDPCKIVIVPPWDVQDPQLFHRADIRGPENPFTRDHGLAGKFVVLYSGNLSIVHPLTTLLDAAAELKDDRELVFLFVGGGLRTREVESYRARFFLTNILQLPYQPKSLLPYSLSCADVHIVVLGEAVAGLVHTSKVYGTLMAGIPFIAIAPRRSHLGDLVRDVPGGFLVEHGDTKALIAALRICRTFTEEERAQIRHEQREFLLANFRLENLLMRFELVALKNKPAKISGRLANKASQC